MEEGAVGWSWRRSNGAVRWSSLLSSLAAALWAALQVLLHTVDPLWDRAQLAAIVNFVAEDLRRRLHRHAIHALHGARRRIRRLLGRLRLRVLLLFAP